MAYRFEVAETSRESFRRNSREQLDRAIQELTDGVKVDSVKGVHEARKALKQERALLRLARAAIKPRLRRRENAALRDVAARLSSARDSDVMLEALDTLAVRYAGQVPESTLAEIRSRFDAERHGVGLLAEAIDRATEELRAARRRAGDWRLERDGWKAIAPGLRWAHAQGAKAFASARRDPTVENMHEWRKRAKDLWYALRLLEPTAPLILDGEVKAAHRLSDLLGDDHDLALLHKRVLKLAPTVPHDVGSVLALIEHDRRRLRREAFALGRQVYAEKSGAFGRRIHAYWKAAHAPAADDREIQQVGAVLDAAPVV